MQTLPLLTCHGKATATRTVLSSLSMFVQEDLLTPLTFPAARLMLVTQQLREITTQIPNLGEDMLANLGDDGIIRIGARLALAIFWLWRSL